MTQQELLNLVSTCDITDMSAILTQIKTMTDRQYLDMHKQKTWCGSNGRFCTHVYMRGKRVLISKGTQEELENYIIEFYKGNCKCYSVDEVFYEWLSKKLEYEEIGRNSYDRYLATYKKYFGSIKDLSVKTITAAELENFIKTSIRDFKLTTKGWNNLRIIIRGIFKQARKNGLVDFRIEDFLEDLDLPPRIFTRNYVIDEEEVFTDAEVEMIVNYINGCNKIQADYGILLALETGMRAGEISTLKYSDMSEGVLTVARTEIRYHDNGNVVYGVKDATKGKNGRRKIPLTASAITNIEMLHEMSGTDALFSVRGQAMTNRLYRICDKLGIPKRSIHKCRKTYATMLISKGIPDAAVANVLGHTDTITTYRHYVFDNLERTRENDIVTSAVKDWLKSG